MDKGDGTTQAVISSKILKISDEKLRVKNDEIQVLHVECESLREDSTQIANFTFKNFPNVFVIAIKLSKAENASEDFENLIIRKLPDNRPIIVEISSDEGTTYRVKHRGENQFSTINLSNEDTRGLTINALLHILNNSLLNADYSSVISHFKDTKIDPIIHALNAGDELSFRLLRLFKNEEFSQENQGKIFLIAIKSKNINLFLAAMKAFNESQVTKDQIKELLSIKIDSHCAFMTAIESKNEKIVRFLLKFVKDFPDFFTFKLFEESLKAIKKREFFEVFDDLKNSEFNATTEEKEILKKILNECEEILSDISNLHSSIKDKKLSEVKNFARKHPNYRLCYGKSQICALELSIDHKQFNIYAFLRSEGFYTDKGEKLNEKIQNLRDREKELIRVENLKYVVDNPESYIGILLSKCSFDPQSPIASSDVREMLLKFKEIDEINSTFPTIAHADFKTIFDYANESVSTMNPNGDEFTLGYIYFEKGLLYVGKNVSKNQRYGTFAHETMHFVLLLVFENRCLPYCKGDTVREVEWDEVVKKVKAQYESNPETTDNIIKWVFQCYGSDYQQSAELAVRVNDILAFHHDNHEKIVELEGLHPELFSYIRTKVLPDLKIPNVYRMIKLNNDFGLLQRTEDSELQVKPTDKSDILDLVTEGSKRVLIVTNVPQLMLFKILQEIENLAGNKLNLKARNIFVDAKVLKQKHVKNEFEALIETTEVDRIIADSSNFQEILDDLKPEVQCILVATQSNEELLTKFNFIQLTVNIQWKDLSEETQKFLLEKSIKFQESTIELSKILLNVETSITPEILSFLCAGNEIKVNCESKVEKVKKFIDRTVQMKVKGGKKQEFEDFSLENFLLKTQSEQILVISDVAGSGKTTLLTKIHENLMQKFPEHFIIFIPLLKYVDELTEGVGESFTEFIAKVLKFNPLENEIFMQKYSKGEVKILFDAFDEISPKCMENTKKLFNNFLKNDKNQIFITTRTHLEHDLEKNLKVLAHRIKILTEEEQIKFLVEFWESWGNLDKDLIRKCAKLLVDKISQIIATKTSLIGVPLIVQGLAEAYKDKIDENFEREIKNLDILCIYEQVIKTSFNILSSRFPQNPVKNQEKSMSLMQIHQYLAVFLLFSKKIANSLGLTLNEDEWPLEEVARFGLIKYEYDGKFYFNHQPYAEYFISGFVFDLIKSYEILPHIQLNFIFQVLIEEKFKVTRMFLDFMLRRVEKFQDLKSFNSSQEICKKVKNEKNFLNLCVNEKRFNIFEFFVRTTKKEIAKLFKEVIEHTDENEATSLMRILPHAKNLTNFEIFLDEILNFYSKNVFDDFFGIRDKFGDTILHYFAAYCQNLEVFECFWNKIEYFLNYENKLNFFLMLKGNNWKNALLHSVEAQNEVSFFFLFEHVYCKFFSIKEFAYETNEVGENLLHFLARFGSVPMLKFATEKLKNELSPEDFHNFIKLKSKNGNNLLHCAALQNKNEKSVEFLVNFIENEVGSEEVKKMLSELGNFKTLPLHYAVEYNNLKVFEFFFSLYEKNFNFHELKNIMMTPFDGNKNIFTLMRKSGKILSKSELSKWQEVLDKYQETCLSELDLKTDDNLCVEANLFGKIKEIKEKIFKKCRFNSSISKKPLKELSGIIDKICTLEAMILIADTIVSYDNIIFDFNPNKDFINSTQYYSTLPEYGEDLIYVVINFNNEEEKKFKFIHEMVKKAMQIVYGNKGLPYFNHEKDKEEELNILFNEIIEFENFKDFKSLNEIFPKYFATGFKSEVNDKILNLFNKCVKQDLEIPDGNKIRELNRKFCLLKRLKKPQLKLHENSAIEIKNLNETILIKSNVPRMVLEKIYREIKLSSCVDAENLFVNLNLINFDDIRELYLEIASSKSIKSIFVDASNCSEKNLIILKEGNPKAQIIYVATENVLFTDLKEIIVDFTWNDFCEESQKKLLSKKIEYQNKFEEFGEIFTSDYEELPCEFIEKLCSNQTMIISPIAPLPNLIEIERKFAIKRKIQDEIMFMRTCNESDFYFSKNESISDLLNYVKSSPIISLTGETRTGKTKALQQIEKRLSDSQKYVKYLKFEDFDEYKGTDFKKYMRELIRKKFELRDLLNFGKNFDNGNFILILDEINEVDETKLFNILQNFKETKNQLWLGVEEIIGKKIEERFDPEVIRLMPLTEEEEKNFLLIILKESCEGKNLPYNYSKDSTTTNICEKYFNTQVEPSLKQVFFIQTLQTYQNNHKFDESKFFSEKPNLLNDNEELFEVHKNGCFYLRSPCFLRFLVAEKVKEILEKHDFENFDVIFSLFIEICTEKEHIKVRKTLNELTIDLPNKKTAKNYGNLFKKSLQRDFELQINLESDFVLATYLIYILKNADWNESNLLLTTVISKMLISLEPYINSSLNADEFLKMAFEVSKPDFIKLTNKRDQNNQRLFEVIASKSVYTNLIEFIFVQLVHHNINPSEFFPENDENIFKLAIEHKNINLLEFLLENLEISFNKWKKVLKMAFDSEDFKIFDTMKMENKLELHEQVKEILSEYQKTFDEIYQFHSDILDENIPEMSKFVSKFPNLRICKGCKSLNALQLACRKQKFKSFKFLISKNFNSDLNDLKELVRENCRNQILNINISNSTQDDSYYKNLLLMKCLKAPSSSSISFNAIIRMIDDLFELGDVKEVLSAISTTDVQIIFDLIHQSTKLFDPKTDEYHYGMFYIKRNQILVAKCDSIQTRYGAFTHEATHSAMLSLYNNKCNPYFKDDVETMKEWQGIVKELKEMHDREEIDEVIIDSVFSCNDEALHESELIVRVPQLYAFHLGVIKEINENGQISNGPNNTIMRLKQKYPRLFLFYDTKVLRDLRIVDGISLRIVNKEFKLWDTLAKMPIHLDCYFNIKHILKTNKCLIFNTSSPILLLKLIFDTTRSFENVDANFLKHKSSNVFIDAKILFEIIENCHDKESFISKLNFFLKSVTVERIIILFDGISADVSRKSVENLKKIINVSKKIIFLNPPQSFMEAKTIDVTFSWSMNVTSSYNMCLNDATKVKIKNKEITFNDNNIKISDILSDYDMMSITPDALNFVCLKQNIQLNNFLQNSPPYFERQFEEKTNFSNEILTQDEMLKVSENEKFILLSGPIGNGKSVVLKNLYEQKVKGNVKNKLWVAFASLKNVLKDSDTVTLEIFYSILGIENSFQKLIFDKFYKNKKIILYLDEIDQIDEESREKLIIFIKNSSFCQVWLTCRPNQEEIIKNQLENIKVFSIKLFNRDEKFEYVHLIANNNHFTDVHCKKLVNFDHFAFPHLIFTIKHLYGEDINEAILTKLKLLTLCEHYFKIFKENIHESDLKTFDEASTYWSLSFHSKLKEDVFGCDDEHEDIWDAEKLMQCGLFEDSKRLFINQIVSQLIVAKFSKQKLLKPKKKWGYNDDFANFFSKILDQNDLKTSRILVNDLLDNFSEQANRIDYKIYGEHLETVISDFGQLLQRISSQELTNIHNYLTKVSFSFPGTSSKNV